MCSMQEMGGTATRLLLGWLNENGLLRCTLRLEWVMQHGSIRQCKPQQKSKLTVATMDMAMDNLDLTTKFAAKGFVATRNPLAA